MFRAFWMEGSGEPRADSNYVYLNVYDQEDRFRFQVYWSPHDQEVVRSATEHY